MTQLHLEARTLRQETVQRLRAEILSGGLPPGSKLREADLASRLGVSRSPIREAISQLEQQGLVVCSPNRGAFVARPDPGELRDMLRLRAHLEILALRLAFSRRISGAFQSLEGVVNEMDRLSADSSVTPEEAWGRQSLLDSDFHQLLIGSAGSRALERAWAGLAPSDFVFLRDREQIADLGAGQVRAALAAVAERHRRLYAALQGGSLGAALRALEAHFSAPDCPTPLSANDLNLLCWGASETEERER